MTTVAAIKINGRLAIAADGGRYVGQEVITRSARKILVHGSVAIAACGDSRNLAILGASLDSFPAVPAGEEEIEPIWQWIKAALTADGYLWKSEEGYGAVHCGQQFFVILGPEIYYVASDGPNGPLPDGEGLAIGSGSEYAIGFMEAVVRFDWSAQTIVHEAVGAAKKWNAYTSGGTLLVERGVEETVFEETWTDP